MAAAERKELLVPRYWARFDVRKLGFCTWLGACAQAFPDELPTELCVRRREDLDNMFKQWHSRYLNDLEAAVRVVSKSGKSERLRALLRRRKRTREQNNRRKFQAFINQEKEFLLDFNAGFASHALGYARKRTYAQGAGEKDDSPEEGEVTPPPKRRFPVIVTTPRRPRSYSTPGQPFGNAGVRLLLSAKQLDDKLVVAKSELEATFRSFISRVSPTSATVDTDMSGLIRCARPLIRATNIKCSVAEALAFVECAAAVRNTSEHEREATPTGSLSAWPSDLRIISSLICAIIACRTLLNVDIFGGSIKSEAEGHLFHVLLIVRARVRPAQDLLFTTAKLPDVDTPCTKLDDVPRITVDVFDDICAAALRVLEYDVITFACRFADSTIDTIENALAALSKNSKRLETMVKLRGGLRFHGLANRYSVHRQRSRLWQETYKIGVVEALGFVTAAAELAEAIGGDFHRLGSVIDSLICIFTWQMDPIEFVLKKMTPSLTSAVAGDSPSAKASPVEDPIRSSRVVTPARRLYPKQARSPPSVDIIDSAPSGSALAGDAPYSSLPMPTAEVCSSPPKLLPLAHGSYPQQARTGPLAEVAGSALYGSASASGHTRSQASGQEAVTGDAASGLLSVTNASGSHLLLQGAAAVHTQEDSSAGEVAWPPAFRRYKHLKKMLDSCLADPAQADFAEILRRKVGEAKAAAIQALEDL